jgi:hypothetical protein
VTDLLDALRRLYGEDDAHALAVTAGGLWHATPLKVAAAVVPVLEEAGLLPPEAAVLDAGAGDGRLLAALALGARRRLRLVGIESDPVLAARARARLGPGALRGPGAAERKAPRPSLRIVHGDFFHPRYHEAAGLAPSSLDLVLNYPDGNERRLLAWLGEHGGSQTRLAVLGPDRALALGREPSLRREVRPPGRPVAWTLSVYEARAAFG